MSFAERVSALNDEELAALARAGTWYANYFAREIADEEKRESEEDAGSVGDEHGGDEGDDGGQEDETS